MYSPDARANDKSQMTNAEESGQSVIWNL